MTTFAEVLASLPSGDAGRQADNDSGRILRALISSQLGTCHLGYELNTCK